MVFSQDFWLPSTVAPENWDDFWIRRFNVHHSILEWYVLFSGALVCYFEVESVPGQRRPSRGSGVHAFFLRHIIWWSNNPKNMIKLVVSAHFKNMLVKLENLPQLGMKIKNLWNHHPVIQALSNHPSTKPLRFCRIQPFKTQMMWFAVSNCILKLTQFFGCWKSSILKILSKNQTYPGPTKKTGCTHPRYKKPVPISKNLDDFFWRYI